MFTPAARLAWLICLLWPPLAAQTIVMSPGETRSIVALGPWPPPALPNLSNRVSTKIDAV